jgi:predicted dehydrogenase
VDESQAARRVTTWGLLSTARINERVLSAAQASRRVEFAAVASRSQARADAYAAQHRLARAYGSYDELLADDALDAIYVSLPNDLHVEWAIRALEANKHVLCEKPLTRDPREASRAFAVAARCSRLLSEGFMWRHHPQTRMVQQLLADGAIGRVVEVNCSLGFDLIAEADGSWRSGANDPRLSAERGGGALMDVGTYCVSAIRLFAGEPLRLTGTSDLGPTGVDVRTSGVLECCDGATGRFACSLVDSRREELEIVGEHATVRVNTPFLCKLPRIDVQREDATQTIHVTPTDSYRLELENMSEAILDGTPLLLGADDAVRQATVLDAVHRSATLGHAVELEAPAKSTNAEAVNG